MANMDFRNAAKKLGDDWLKPLGYYWRVDTNTGSHPRMYIRSNNGPQERFTILSSTSNYDEGNLLHMKKKDIERDVLPHLKTPTPLEIGKTNGSGESSKGVIDCHPRGNEEENFKVYPMKVYINSASRCLCVQVPKDAIPPQAQRAQPILYPENKFGLIFSADGGREPKKVGFSGAHLVYHFPRTEVPFKYAHEHPHQWKPGVIYSRRVGDTLVTDTPLADELLEVVAKKPTPKKVDRQKVLNSKDGEYKLEDGSSLREMINDWCAWARAAGHEPTLKVTDEGELSIIVVTKVVQKL